MRDLLFSGIILGFLPFAFRHPWIGVLLWTWLSVMSPHRFTWGFAYDFSWAAIVAAVTFLGLLFTKDRRQFPTAPVTVTLVLLLIWMTVTTIFALSPDAAWAQWNKVSKIFLMIIVTASVLHTKRHIELFVWITIGSVAFYGVKGGIFTLTGGGMERVYGPEGSFIQENNSLALATIMCIPLLYYVRMTVADWRIRLGMLAAMGLCAVSALGSHSRGGFLALGGMAVLLWWRSKNKVIGLILLALSLPGIGMLMPEKWETRMESIVEYEQDSSAMGRINTWIMALNLVRDRPLVGGGFDMYTPSTFARWGPDPLAVHAAHSIYFQMLGEHGIPGLVLYLLLGMFTWRTATWIRREARKRPEYQWAFWLASMTQVSIGGFAVGGAFLSLAYFDVPYNLMVALVLTKCLMQRELAAKGGEQLQSNDNQPRAQGRVQALPAGVGRVGNESVHVR
jgi:probable O-glycosylation ligase (exosortase A-associated)